jgi:hypothetical protein
MDQIQIKGFDLCIDPNLVLVEVKSINPRKENVEATNSCR